MASRRDSNADGLVLVTGATGYVGTFVVKHLLEQGYDVVACVRDLKNSAKLKPLLDLSVTLKAQLELVQADLCKTDSLRNVVSGCRYVIHTAGPYPAHKVTEEEEIATPTIDGTLALLEACSQHHVRRVVMTGNLTTVSGGFGDPSNKTRVFTEKDWIDIEKKDLDPYVRIKATAELAAWKYYSSLPDEDRFELVVLLPAFIVGPFLCEGYMPAAAVTVYYLMTKKLPVLPKLYWSVCDVRDVADAHVRAMILPQAAGQRIIIYGCGMWVKEMCQVLETEFKPQGYSFNSIESPTPFMSLIGWFDDGIKWLKPYMGITPRIDNSKMKTMLGIISRDVTQSIRDMAYSLIEKGFVPKKKKYQRPLDHL